jgi:hypothetical protein
MKNKTHAILLALFCVAVSALPAAAQAIKKPQSGTDVSETAMHYTKMVAQDCSAKADAWSSNGCLRTLSESNRVMISNYMETLDREGQTQFVELVKNSCAASTAAEQGTYPADAMKSAFIECANAISDVAEASRLAPDLAHYELLAGSILCMSNDRRCREVSFRLHQFRMKQ